MELAGIRGLLRRPPPGSGDLAKHLDRYVGGNRLTLLWEPGQALDSMLAAVASAQDTIHLETYIFKSDRTGHEFAERLVERARAGVRVRVIIDSLGSMDINPVVLTHLRNAGVQLLEYHPVAPWRPRWSWGRRSHRKILVVDGRVGFTGGVNISDHHRPVADGGQGWHDAHVRVEGPAAFELERLFRMVWFRETQRWFTSVGHPERAPGTARVWVAGNQEFLNRYQIRFAYLHVLRAAQFEVLIANAYFIPDRGIRRALAAATKRGCDVRLLVPGRSDVTAAWYAGRYRYDFLLRNGARLFEWPGPMMHAKTAVIDRRWCAVGTYNLDHRSLLHNLEVNLHALDDGLAKETACKLEEDLGRSRELTLEAWRRRSLVDRFFERLFYTFRYFF